MKATPNLGVRRTKQKQCILEILAHAKGPLRAQEIHELSLNKVPGIGIATVYRSLAQLLSQQEICSVSMPMGEMRYEQVREAKAHHHHFFCRACSKAFDLKRCPIGKSIHQYAPAGFQVDGHELTLLGICAECTGMH